MSKFWNSYEEERNKLTILPDADADFIALSNTYERMSSNTTENNYCDYNYNNNYKQNEWWY